MQFTKESGELITYFIPHVTEKKENRSFNKILLQLYRDILKADEYVNDKMNQDCFKTHLRGKGELLKCSLLEGSFVPPKIRQYIHNHIMKQLIYRCIIHDRVVKVVFSIFSEDQLKRIDKYNRYVKFIYTWLYICQHYSLKRCSKEIIIFLNLTSYKKVLPSNPGHVIDVDNVNTAVTYACAPEGEMLIYREEEWIKVFIHETFHSFGFDYGLQNNSSIKPRFQSFFEIESDFAISESYTEVWARILNCAFNIFYSLTDITNTNDFLLYIHFCFQIERLMAISQLIKVLNYMGISYQLLTEKSELALSQRRNLYREKSNVFAYYIVSAILLNNVDLFLKWCLMHNSNLFLFSQNATSVTQFIDFIFKEYKNPGLLDTIQTLEKKHSKKKFINMNLRMSAIEYAI